MAELFDENRFEDQIDAKIKSVISNDFKQPETHNAEVLRKDSEGRWWVRFEGTDDETPILVNKIDMRVGDIITVTVKDHQSIADGNLTSPALSAANTYGYVDRVVADIIKATEAEIGYLKAETATIGYAQIQDADITNARIQNLVYEVTTNTNHLTAVDASILSLETNALTANSAIITNLQADAAKIHDFTAESFQAAFGFVSELVAEDIEASDIIADHAEIQDLDTNYAHVVEGVIDNAKIDHANVDGLEATYARIDSANLTEAIFQTAWADAIMVQTGLLAKEGTVYSLDAIEVNAVNITAGTLDVERLIVTVDGEKYLLDASNYTYILTEDTDIYKITDDTAICALTEDISVDSSKTYYTIDDETGVYAEVEEPSDEDIGSYYERLDPDKVYYDRDSQTGVYSVVDELSETDLSGYYERLDPRKIYYVYNALSNTYTAVEIPTEVDLSSYYELANPFSYVKLDGDVLGERTIAADKLIANSITSRELTTENIRGEGGWINLAEGTFEYVNATTGKGISWDGVDLTIYGGYEEQIGSVLDAVGVFSWITEHAVLTEDTTPQPGITYYSLSEDSYSEVLNVESVYSLTVDTEVDGLKTYYVRTEDYVLTEDEHVNPSKTYYTYDSSDDEYVIVADPTDEGLPSYYEIVWEYTAAEPLGTEDPSDEGWYEKGNPKLQGLYVLDDNLYSFLSSHIFDDGTGTVLKDSSSGYSIKMSQNGFYIMDISGNVVGKYGEDMQIGALSSTHLVAAGDTLMFLPPNTASTLYVSASVQTGDSVSGLYEYEPITEVYFPTSDSTAQSGKTYYMAMPNVEAAVAYIAVDPDTRESVFYMTRSVVVKDMFLGEGKWKFYKRANNNLSLKWMGEM